MQGSAAGCPLSVGRVFERAFSTIRHNPVATIGLALLIGAIPGIFSGWIVTQAQADLINSMSDSPTTGFAYIAVMLLSVGLSIMIFAFTLAVLTRATAAHAQGSKSTIGESLMAGFAVLLPLIVLGVLFALAVMAGLMLLIVPGVILWVMWSVAVPVLVEEREGIVAAFGRSRELTKGARWKIFAIALILLVIYYLISILAAVVGFGAINAEALAGNQFELPFGFLVISAITGTFVNVMWGTVIASLYVELRDWKDGPATDALEDVFA